MPNAPFLASGQPFIASVLSTGFYKFGYVTNDREHAVEVLKDQLGVEQFVEFEPSFTGVTHTGETGAASLRCAFSAGRDMFIEVLQPVSGPLAVFTDFLTDSVDFQLRFHHVSVIVDDLAEVVAAAAQHDIVPELSARLGNGMSFTYMRLPGMGHFVEHDQYDGDSQSFLDGIAARSL